MHARRQQSSGEEGGGGDGKGVCEESETVPSQPAEPSQPEPSQPEPSQPEPSQPVPSQPVPPEGAASGQRERQAPTWEWLPDMEEAQRPRRLQRGARRGHTPGGASPRPTAPLGEG
jgi:cell division protein FtsN